MTKTLKLICLFLLTGNFAFAQANQELAKQKLKEAVKLEDEQGKYDEALKLILEAQQLDPENIDYPYELAYTYNAKKEYKKSIEVLEKLLTHKDVYDQVYQALGSAYDYDGNSEKAISTYELGLTKFPKSGVLYTELGNMNLNKKDYTNAVKYYEKGIEVSPKSTANYYRVAKIFLATENELWGLIYGEIFMNLERSSKRTEEMSKLLFDTYKSQITFKNDTSLNVSLYKNVMTIEDVKNMEKKGLPFGMAYEMTTSLATISLALSKGDDRVINLNSLNTLRSNFLKFYYEKDFNKKYPNILFDYQKEIEKQGHLEAYNHWILMKGDEVEFSKWKNANLEKWDSFIKWFGPNPLKLSEGHYFNRNQYN
jgi:tetratricopeptide (TPR) repeat protein